MPGLIPPLPPPLHLGRFFCSSEGLHLTSASGLCHFRCKCERYWPAAVGESFSYAGMTITLVSETPTCAQFTTSKYVSTAVAALWPGKMGQHLAFFTAFFSLLLCLHFPVYICLSSLSPSSLLAFPSLTTLIFSLFLAVAPVLLSLLAILLNHTHFLSRCCSHAYALLTLVFPSSTTLLLFLLLSPLSLTLLLPL